MTGVLVTAAGSAPALAFVRGLRKAGGYHVVGVDGVADSFGLFECDARYTVPRVASPDFLPALHRICAHEHVRVIAPILDFELDLFAAAASGFADAGVRVITNSPETVALARDKARSTAAAAAAGVAVPRGHPIGPLPPLPVVVKPTTGAGSNGVTVVRRPEALAAALEAAGPRPLVQDFVDGDEYTVDLLVTPGGEVLAAAPRLRAEVRSGQSYKGRTVDDAELADAAARVARAHGMTGQGNVQLIRPRHGGPPAFIELNPKFGAAMGLTIGAGLNLPHLYVKLALGLPIEPHELVRRADVWMLRAWQERYLDAAEVAAVPPWSAAGPGLPGPR